MKPSAALVLSFLAITHVPAQSPRPPQKVRLVAPATLPRGTSSVIFAEGSFDGKEWKPLAADQLGVHVAGAGKLVEDLAGKPTNPFEVRCDDADGKLTVEVQAGGLQASRTFAVGTVKPAGPFELTVQRNSATHRFTGLGGGVLFYDNQFDITAGDDIYDWCFKDVRTSYLHVLIRPDYEKENDNDDWRTLDLSKFDFKALDRPFRIIKKALQRNPALKVYASLYSPPAWMKSDNSTSGKGMLKPGLRFRQELAEYVYAYLKHAARNGIVVHYLSFFNEPDFAHTQDGMFFPDLGDLADTFVECAKALDTLLAADTDIKEKPTYVFPDALGAGAITRGRGSQALRQRARQLERVGVWGVHDYWKTAGTYWNDRYKELRAFPGVGQKPVWMTEWAQRERHGDLFSSVEFGTQILNALRLGAEGWMVFEWCHPSGNQAGLISTDWGAKAPHERYWRSKAYHVFRQIANTSPAGAQVLAAPGRGKSRSVEYLALQDGDTFVVHVMNAENGPFTCRVTARAAVDKVEAWQTTPLANLEQLAAKDVTLAQQADSATVASVVPGNSLITFVIHARPAR